MSKQGRKSNGLGKRGEKEEKLEAQGKWSRQQKENSEIIHREALLQDGRNVMHVISR
jgi:hypothetical protein